MVAYQKFHANVGVLSLTGVDVCRALEAMVELKTASCRTSASNSRSELVIAPSGLVKLTSF